MRPDAENDTRSPWYEAFALNDHPQMAVTPVVDVAKAASLAGPVWAEPDSASEALFDCYNS